MSGDVRLLDANGETARLVAGLSALVRTVSPDRFALIGGLAVMARLGRAHRGTLDIDTASVQEDSVPPEIALLVEAADSLGAVLPPTQPSVKVDSIDVGTVPAADLSEEDLPDDEFPRAFVLSHRWAFDTALDLTIRSRNDAHGDVAVTCRVATPAALVAMKLQSAPRRPPARVHKSANDYLDLMLLLSHVGLTSEIAAGLQAAPHGLGQWCARRITVEFLDNAARVSSRIHQGPTRRRVSPDELRNIGTRFQTSGRRPIIASVSGVGHRGSSTE